MSFPNVIYGGFGDEKVASSAKIGNLPLGQLMILPDGRKFRHAQAGSATALEAGALVSTSAVVTDHGGVAASGLIASATTTYNAVGATSVQLMTDSIAVTLDQYAGGYMNVQGPAASTYIGSVYKIKSNKSAAVSSLCEIKLEATDGLKVAFAASSTTCSLRRNPYGDAIVAACTKTVMGSVPVAVSASFYFWVQKSGPASLQTGATTLTDGLIAAVDKSAAGSVTLGVAASQATQHIIGRALETVTATEAGLVDMSLE